ncbi:hypothetical protein GLOTRDRAFT_141507, partial [Gloeophyllum trabeum ATCC 11539]
MDASNPHFNTPTMLSLRSGVVRVPTYNPKMDLLGMPVLDSCKVPSLDLVGQDAAK